MFNLINSSYFLIVYDIVALSITNLIVDHLEHLRRWHFPILISRTSNEDIPIDQQTYFIIVNKILVSSMRNLIVDHTQ
jgi:hypothetical protein